MRVHLGVALLEVEAKKETGTTWVTKTGQQLIVMTRHQHTCEAFDVSTIHMQSVMNHTAKVPCGYDRYPFPSTELTFRYSQTRDRAKPKSLKILGSKPRGTNFPHFICTFENVRRGPQTHSLTMVQVAKRGARSTFRAFTAKCTVCLACGKAVIKKEKEPTHDSPAGYDAQHTQLIATPGVVALLHTSEWETLNFSCHGYAPQKPCSHTTRGH